MESSVGQIFISDNQDMNFKKDCKLELNTGNLVDKSIYDSSGTGKKGLLIPHGLGVIDQDYCGPSDEILIQVFNFTNQEVIVERGDRIAQGIFVKVENAKSGVNWQEIDQINHQTRGGFGSTNS